MRAVLYCRVSTMEQVDNLSLPTQEKACREYAERHGYTVAHVFVDRGESAKTTDRPEFQRMLTACRKERGKLHAVIVYGLSRFSRNNADHHAIAALLRGQGIALRSVTEPIDDSPAGRFMEAVIAGMAQFDNDQRSDRTKVGMRAAAERGRWIWPAPLGYLTGPKGPNAPSLVLDPVRAPLIRRAFEAMATTDRGVSDVWREAKAAGLRTRTGLTIPLPTLHRVLRAPLYAGRLRCDSLGANWPGDWAPLVSEATWDRVQLRLNQDGRTRPKNADHPDYPLRQFVHCATCQRPMTAGWSKGRSAAYAYYRCVQNCPGIAAPRAVLETAFVDLLDRLRPDQEWLDVMRRTILVAWRAEHDSAIEQRSQLEAERTRLESQMRRLDEVFIFDQAIDQETYHARRAEVRERLALASLALSQATTDTTDIEGELAEAEFALVHASALWRTAASADAKVRLQRAILPEGVAWNGTACLNRGNTLTCYHLGADHEVGLSVGGPPVRDFERVTAWSAAWRAYQTLADPSSAR